MATNELIPALAPQVGRVTAFSALDVRRDDPGRWLGGYEFQPEACDGGFALPMNCFGNTTAMGTTEHPDNILGSGWIVGFGDVCSTFGFQDADYEARARRGLSAVESYQFARELWTGEQTGPAGSPTLSENRPLADPEVDVIGSGALAPDPALACLEQALMVCGMNRRGFIHATPQLMATWVVNGAIRREGGIWLTPSDNVIVSDAGYLGSDPDTPTTPPTTTQWAYATSWMQVRVGQVMVVGGPNADGIDRSVNTVKTWAVEPVMVQWDQCCHLGIEVSLAACG